MGYNKANDWKKSLLVAAVSGALMLTGCAGEDGEDGAQGSSGLQGPVGPTGPQGPTGDNGQDGESSGGTGENGSGASAFAYTTSNYAIYSDSIFVADYFDGELSEGADITDAINMAIFDLQDGQTIVLPQGNFKVSDTILIQDMEDVTFTGYGINETQLSFKEATAAEDAVRFEGCKDVEIRDFTVLDPKKNGIKVKGSDGVLMAYTGAVWPEGLKSDNGAYGLYPVSSSNIIMEYNYSYGSADAGIYVGQSNNVVVRHNVARMNVAGIEIENTMNADVYKNLAIENTGGILVFDLPGLEQAYGGNVRVFDNEMIANNTENVAPFTSTVGLVPPGTGFLNLATSGVEVYHNYFRDNKTSAMEFASYFLVQDDFSKYENDYLATMIQGWSPNYKLNYVHDNVIERSGADWAGLLLQAEIVPLPAGVPEGTPQFTIANGFTGLTLELVADPTTFESMPTGGVVDNTGKLMPAILFDGIGQFVFTQTDLFQDEQLLALTANKDAFTAYESEDGLCLQNNIDGNSAASHSEFGDAKVGTVFPVDMAGAAVKGISGGLPAPVFALDNIHGDAHPYACTQERLSPTTVTFRGMKYGCNGDDQTAFSCNL
ncbi:hypothetical protein E2K93_11120 [Thalassotalea sp. HSM 43]|uniref:parallel beta-helix domain-containing protein n=1 Tax=Thalassotalea sp. HSM 43 TaxID=2552945 RepID=UPI0010807152|nr:parallel beta-helix domain-containing protein [Thalassotalea sp. HSM 43]QBY04898.1 hypothetical protein E2K93_11120 [Thalassotalea sp. HSM 43]